MPSEPHDREQHTPPRRATHRIQAHSHSFRQQDECDDCHASHRANHQRQNQNDLLLTLPQFSQTLRQPYSPPTVARLLDAPTHLHEISCIKDIAPNRQARSRGELR